MAIAWRLLKTKRVAKAFTGEGARLRGGRWNSPGTTVVYLGESISLSVLEVLVHLEAIVPFEAYSLIQVDFDPSSSTDLDVRKLPPNWASSPVPSATQEIGDAWVASAASMLLRVPSAVVPTESNILLNPAHADLKKLKVGKPAAFRFDPRLFR